MADSTFQTVLKAQAALGECPLWSVAEQVLWWVDIEGRTLNRFDPATGDTRLVRMDENIGCIGLRAGGGFIAGLRSGLWLLDAQGRKDRLIANPQEDTSLSRFNDGRVDPFGRFWAGTIWEPREPPGAGLWRVEADLSCHLIETGLTVSNGLAFSPDRRWAYHADTPAHTIWRYPMHPETGATGPREIFHHFEDESRPDGAAVDQEGCYWVALYRGGRVVRLSPEGEIIADYPVPALCPTMCAFGGPDLSTLYVTSARHDRPDHELAEWPESGNLFAMETDTRGQPEPLFGRSAG